jgi:hypothetical protein
MTSGKYYYVEYTLDQGRGPYIYCMTAMYLGSLKNNLQFSLRPEAGTTEIPKDTVITLKELQARGIKLPHRIGKAK